MLGERIPRPRLSVTAPTRDGGGRPADSWHIPAWPPGTRLRLRTLRLAPIVFAYTTLAVVWIVSSDALLAVFPAAWHQGLQTVKGLGFVAVTALGLLALLARERTAISAAQEALWDVNERLSALFANAPLPILVLDRNGIVTSWNPAAERTFGWSAEEVIGRPNPIGPPEGVDELRTELDAVIDAGTGVEREVRRLRRDGTVLTLRRWFAPLRDPLGELSGAIGIFEDIGEQLRAAAERERLIAAIEQAADAALITDADGRIVFVNRAFEAAFGCGRADIVGQPYRTVAGGESPEQLEAMAAALAAGKSWSGSASRQTADGSTYYEERTVSPVLDQDAQPLAYVAMIRNVTREHALEAELAEQARQQAELTALFERMTPAETPEATASAICEALRSVGGVDMAAVLAFGVGRLVVPLAVAGLQQRPLSPGTSLPRSRASYLRERSAGGAWVDEWRTELPGARRYASALAAAGLRAVAYLPLRDREGIVGLLTVGVSATDGQTRLAGRLSGLDHVAALSAALLAPAIRENLRRGEMTAHIREVIRRRAFTPVFQPIVELRTGRVVGHEALTRFADGVRPDLRFAEAASVGLGTDLDLACLASAIEAARLLPPRMWLSVNVTPALALDDSRLRGVLGGADRTVVVEITEHVEIDDYATLRAAIDRLGPGIRLAVDDAGAGFASLRHILELRPDWVKLDIGLIRAIEGDIARQAMVAGMGHFAAQVGCQLLAEGVETEAERAVLERLSIKYGQGHLFGKPIAAPGLPGPQVPTSSLGPERCARPNA